MSETPERPGRSSRAGSRPGSRSNTPHRARSKTPVRTPTRRRRATIVSANLVASRRPHRQSVSPQNILRSLSRALVRDRPEQLISDQEQQQQQLDEGHEYDYDINFEEDLNRVPLGPEDEQEKENQRHFEEDQLNTYDQHEQQQQQQLTSSLLPDANPDAPREPLSEIIPRSSLFSDIAIPEGIMRDEQDQLADTSMLQQHPGTDPFLSDSEPQRQHSEEPRTPLTPPHTQNKKPRIQGVRSASRISRDPLHSKSVFKYAQSCTKKPLAKECASLLSQISSEFFDNITADLEAYAEHSKAKDTINARCALLLLKRQRLVADLPSMVDLVDEVMPLEDLLEVKRNERKFRG